MVYTNLLIKCINIKLRILKKRMKIEITTVGNKVLKI